MEAQLMEVTHSAAQRAAAQAAQWASDGAAGQNKAAGLLLQVWGKRLRNRFMFNGRLSDSFTMPERARVKNLTKFRFSAAHVFRLTSRP